MLSPTLIESSLILGSSMFKIAIHNRDQFSLTRTTREDEGQGAERVMKREREVMVWMDER